MILRLLTDYHLEFLSLREGCTGSSESTLVKMPHSLDYMSRLNYFFTFLPILAEWNFTVVSIRPVHTVLLVVGDSFHFYSNFKAA